MPLRLVRGGHWVNQIGFLGQIRTKSIIRLLLEKQVFNFISYSERQKLADRLVFGGLPTLGLEINQATDHLHHLGVNRVSTAKAGGNDGPILDPTNAMFDPHPDLTDGLIVGFLRLSQISAFGFLERGFDDQARDLFLFACCNILDRDQTHPLV